MNATRILIAAALLTSSGAAAAQSATDAQCFILSNAFAAQAKDANAKDAAHASVFFYLGRIREGATGPQLKALFDAQAKTITQANAGSLLDACIKTVQTKQELIQSISPQAKPAPAPGK